jgi:hypothetical protein
VAALVGAFAAVVHTARMKLTREQQAALKKLRVRAFEQDLRSFTAKQLRAEFSTQRTRRVLAKVLTRNVVYQAASWVIEGKAPKISGNLRSLYYQWVKPVVAKLPELLKTKVDFYDETLNALELFIGELGLFSYRDLELVDERWDGAGRRRYLFRVEPLLHRWAQSAPLVVRGEERLRSILTRGIEDLRPYCGCAWGQPFASLDRVFSHAAQGAKSH